MATGKASDDAKSMCSVCLEPYKGRDPKLLPCSHTFCLPCLQDIERHHTQAASDINVGEDNEGDTRTLTFPCPTCRALITVPPGGVTQFQETLTCDLCDRDQVARYSCTECGKICEQCRPCHEKITSDHEVQPLTPKNHESNQSRLIPDYERQLDEQLAVLEEALVTMREEENTLKREKQTVADVISRRADTVRALVTQAEERSQRAVAEVAERLGKRIQDNIITARGRYCRIWQLSSQGGTKGQSTSVPRHEQTALLSDDDFQIYQQQYSRGRQIQTLLHQFDDCAIDMQTVEAYIGTVSSGTQFDGENSNSLLAAFACSETRALERQERDTPLTSLSPNTTQLTRDIADIKDKLDALETIASSLEKQQRDVLEMEILKAENSKLPSAVVSLKESDSRMQQNIVTFQQNVENIREDLLNLQRDITNMQHEFQEVRTTNIKLENDFNILYQQSSLIKSETKKFQDAAEELHKCFKSFEEKSNNLVAFNATLQEDSSTDGLILTKVDCNVGQAYDNKTGIFTVPVTGVYFFIARAMAARESERFYLDIKVSGQRAAESGSNIGSLHPGVNCTVHLLQRLMKGEKVKLSAGCRVKLRHRETSFSGMLVSSIS